MGLLSLREGSKNRHQVGEIRERAREAGTKQAAEKVGFERKRSPQRLKPD